MGYGDDKDPNSSTPNLGDSAAGGSTPVNPWVAVPAEPAQPASAEPAQPAQPAQAPAPVPWQPTPGATGEDVEPAYQSWRPEPAPTWTPPPPQQTWQPNPPQQGWNPVPPPTPQQQPAQPGWGQAPAQPAQSGWSPNPSLPNAGQYMSGWPVVRPEPRRSNRLAQFVAVFAVVLMAFSGGMVLDHYAFPTTSQTPGTSAAPAVSGSPQDSELYNEALKVIRNNYVGRSSLTDKQLLYGSIRGLVDSLGDTGHTIFLTPEEYQKFQDSLNAEVAGIGVWLSESNGIYKIDRVMDGGPAAAAGIKAGDQITAIDGVSVDGLTRDQVATKVRGDIGTKVKISVIHLGATTPVDITVTRAKISVPLVEWTIVPGTHVADILLIEFSDGASDQLQKAITSATSAGATSIILDLRGNPGGYAQEATDVASAFLTSGTVYITVDANGKETSNEVNTDLKHTNLPMVVLVDHNSASSAEIVAGALQDAGRAKVVGVATYGTGTVLQKYTLSDGSVILLGVAYWETPKGHKIFGVGITPDEKVVMPMTAVALDPTSVAKLSSTQLSASGDAELLAAIKDLSK